jgi:hypothetical protein
VKKKLPRYARADVPEVWIENLVDDVLLVFRDPVLSSYQTSLTLRGTETVSILALPDGMFSVDQLLVL